VAAALDVRPREQDDPPVRRVAVVVLLHVLGGYLVLRALVEPFAIDVTDAATYERDWGGPTLAGVLAVHCLPGLAALVLMVRYRRARRVRTPRP
jgi:hypothetical protein